MIRWTYAVIDRPMRRFAQSSAFWTAVTETELSARRGADGELATLVPAGGDACLKLQGVGDAGGAHLDLAVEDLPAALHRAHDLGATAVVRHDEWAVLRSPGGQRFCVVPWHNQAVRPAVVTRPDGPSSRLDQVCLDIGPQAYDAEVAFWTQLTRWESRPSSRPELAILRPPAGLPIRILLQRLDQQRPASAHLDLACSDVDAVRTWHEERGARLVARFPDWLVMKDPANGTYCLTRRDPHTGTIRS